MHLLPQLFMLLSRFRIHFPSQKLLLSQKLPTILEPRGIQNTCANRRKYRTSRLPFMAAIDKPALPGQRIDVHKCLRNTVRCVPQLHLTQARCVHQ